MRTHRAHNPCNQAGSTPAATKGPVVSILVKRSFCMRNLWVRVPPGPKGVCANLLGMVKHSNSTNYVDKVCDTVFIGRVQGSVKFLLIIKPELLVRILSVLANCIIYNI